VDASGRPRGAHRVDVEMSRALERAPKRAGREESRRTPPERLDTARFPPATERSTIRAMMNTLFRHAAVSVLVVCGIATVAAAQSAPVRSDQDILIQLERDWDAAFHRHDAAFIDRVLADEFVVTYDNGVRADRKLELELATSANENIESSEMDEFIVKEFGNTAVVWFTLHLIGPVNGQRVQNDYRFTDVFVLRDGRWQCVSSQSTKVGRP
jgi:ketosteroid isomerase-like protein